MILCSKYFQSKIKNASQQSQYLLYLTKTHLQRFFYNIITLIMKQAVSSFQHFFFQYEIPAPFTSIFTQDIIRNNDVRLLLEIATKSILRMYTDTKTGNLHFICKQRGQQCFDIEAQPHPIQNGYYFKFDYLKVRHKGNCHQEKEAFEYLRIYNLMKLKKRLIEEYMIKLKLDRQSPSVILFRLSNKTEEYFFEKYLNGHLELKRKLRKRFDNIINIDIKRIGKFDDEDEEVRQLPKITSKTSKARKLRLLKERAKMRMLSKRIVEVKLQADILKQRVEIQAMQEVHRQIKLQKFRSGKKISKSEKKKQPKQPKEQTVLIEAQPYPEIFVKKGDEIYEQPQVQEVQQKELPEIMVLNEQAQFIWSESELDSSVEQVSELQVISNEDYFKSLRNSTLKQSLERQSLHFCLFSRESTRDNKQNAL